MTPEQINMFLDKGIVVGLFVVTFIYFLYKGVPAIVKMVQDSLHKINAEHTHQILMLSKTFETTLEAITTKFVTQIELQYRESERYHQEHGKKISEIYEAIGSIKSFKSKK